VAVAPNLLFSTIVAGGNHACGIIRDSGLLYCWGANNAGELGNGTLRTTSMPTPVSAP
jgi:alpha-tubulin suppressor-like RCC1 family protein